MDVDKMHALDSPEAVAEFLRSLEMEWENMEEEKAITESEIIEMLSNLRTTEENERGKGNVNEEKEITESEINEILSSLKTEQDRHVFLQSSIYGGWIRKRDQRFFEDCAKIGLAQYNANNGTNFELDKISRENHQLCPGVVYFHLNFIAKSSDESCMFFAEAVGFENSVVSVCRRLDPVAGMDSDCVFCGDRVQHPRGCSFNGCRPT